MIKLSVSFYIGTGEHNKLQDNIKSGVLHYPVSFCIFQSGGKTLFKTVQFAGTVGAFTGIAPVRIIRY